MSAISSTEVKPVIKNMVRPPHIVHLTSAHPAFDNRIFDRECRYLASVGYKVALIAPHTGDDVVDDIRILAVPKPSNRWERVYRTLPELYRRAVHEQADVYHFHDPELIAVALRLRRTGRKIVYDVHEDYPSTIKCSAWLPVRLRPAASWIFKHIESYASQRFSALIAANSEIKKRISAFNRRTILLGNYPALSDYPDAPQFHEHRYSSGALVSFGGIGPRTCTPKIIEALGMLPDTLPACLLLTGSERSDAMYRSISQMPGWRRVVHSGVLPVREMLARLLNASIAFVLFSPEPNHFGVGSNRLFEALGAGAPVITSDFPNWKKLVDTVGCGIAVNPMNPRAIADAISYLLSHPVEAAAMGHRGFDIAQKQFNWERESSRLRGLYEDLLGSNNVELAAPSIAS